MSQTAAAIALASRAREVPERLRVLQVINTLGQGGTEYGVCKLIKNLDRHLFEHRICTMRGYDADLAGAVSDGAGVIAAGRSGATFQFPLFRLMHIMRQWRPHVVHSRNWGAIEAGPAARLARVPVAIHSEHGYELDMLAGMPRRRALVRRFVYGMLDAVFTVSKELRDYHAQETGVPPQRIRVIYNGVDTNSFVPSEGIRRACRSEFGFVEQEFVIGCVSRLVPIKDHATLLRAAEILAVEGLPVRVLLVGGGPVLPELEAQVAASPHLRKRVTFFGASQRVLEVLNSMDVFVLPSISEGMSNTLLEAMSCGLPVVATLAGGNPEVIEDGSSGLLFAPGDIRGLSSILRSIAGDAEARGRLGVGARARILTSFSLQTMMGKYQDLYLELAQRRGVRLGKEIRDDVRD